MVKKSKIKTRTRTVMGSAPRKRSRRYGSRKFTIPVAVVLGMFPLVNNTWQNYRTSGISGAMRATVMSVTGYDYTTKTWATNRLGNWGPLLMGMAGHWLANRLGLNRRLAFWGVPVVRI